MGSERQGKAFNWISLFVILSTTSVISQIQITTPSEKVIKPPLIGQDPEKVIPFKEGEVVEIPCVATGEPQPIYKWHLNGKPFNPSGLDGRITMRPGVGTLLFARPLERDEGIYQCFAENPLGIAVSVKAGFTKAFLEPFPSAPLQTMYPMLGQSLTLRCTPPASYPAPKIFWGLQSSGGMLKPINMTNRITMDPTGNLHIVQVLQEDGQNDEIYNCIVQNTVIRSIQQGDYKLLSPQGDTVQRKPPQVLWHSPTHQLALTNSTWKIKCIFSGSPSPRVTWIGKNRDGIDMPLIDVRLESFGQELVIDDVQFEDAGVYECQGINEEAIEPIKRTFNLNVEAAPYWVKKPESVDAVENDKVVFHCKSNGVPDSINAWFLNGIPIDHLPNDPRRVVEQNSITFYNVTQDDSQVVQCNSTNKHGYVYANAYLNVLAASRSIITTQEEQRIPTEESIIEEVKTIESTVDTDTTVSNPPLIVEDPEKVIPFKVDEVVEIPCVATGEPQPIYKWHYNGHPFDPSGADGRITMLPGVGTLLFNRPLGRDEGIYQCFAENSLGTAVSVKVNFRKAYLEQFPSTPPQTMYPMLGRSLTLRCTPPASYPAPNIFWGLQSSGGMLKPINMTNRIAMDPTGNLQIVQVLQEDGQNEERYTCVVQNSVMRQIGLGEFKVVRPQGDTVQKRPPEMLWRSPTNLRALRNETLKITCIIAGSPPPQVTWIRKSRDGIDKPLTESFGQDLVINDVQFEDAGEYECQGINEEASVPIRATFFVNVEAAPYWVKKPESVDAIESDKVVFHCESTGIPDPIHFWFLNGIPIDHVPSDPLRVVEKNSITFYNVSKYDTQVVQCNGTNKHGYVLSNAYLNVLDASKVTGQYPTTPGSITTTQEEHITTTEASVMQESKTTENAVDNDTKGSMTSKQKRHISTTEEYTTESKTDKGTKNLNGEKRQEKKDGSTTMILGVTLGLAAVILVAIIVGVALVHQRKKRQIPTKFTGPSK